MKHRGDYDAVVVGDCIAAVHSCFSLAQLGLHVALVTTEIAVPERGVADPSGALQGLFAATETGATAQQPAQWLQTATAKLGELEKYSLLGLPASPLSARTTALIGSAAAVRAYLDRILPVLKIGQHHNLWELTRKRFGIKTAQQLLAPQLRYRFAAPVTEISTDVLPGLAAAVGRRGSLADAILSLAPRSKNAATLLTPEPGWRLWLTDFVTLLQNYGVTVINGEMRDHSFAVHSEMHTVTVVERNRETAATPVAKTALDKPAETESDSSAKAAFDKPTKTLHARALIIAGADPAKPTPATLNRATVTLGRSSGASGSRLPEALQSQLAAGGSAELIIDLAGIDPEGNAAAQLWFNGEEQPQLEIRSKTEITQQLCQQTLRLLDPIMDANAEGQWLFDRVFVPAGVEVSAEGEQPQSGEIDLAKPFYVGAVNHGGELSCALAESQPVLTALRRKLAGIA